MLAVLVAFAPTPPSVTQGDPNADFFRVEVGRRPHRQSQKRRRMTRVAVGATERYAIPDVVVDDSGPAGNRPSP